MVTVKMLLLFCFGSTRLARLGSARASSSGSKNFSARLEGSRLVPVVRRVPAGIDWIKGRGLLLELKYCRRQREEGPLLPQERMD